MNRTNRRSFGDNCLKQRLTYQVFSHAAAHGIADDLIGAYVLMPGQIETPFGGLELPFLSTS